MNMAMFEMAVFILIILSGLNLCLIIKTRSDTMTALENLRQAAAGIQTTVEGISVADNSADIQAVADSINATNEALKAKFPAA